MFFADCKMKGKMVELGPGNYPNSEAIGMPNDTISSINIPKGLKVVIYEDNDYKGEMKEWSATAETGDLLVNCLTDVKITRTKNWNDRISSIKVVAL